MQFSPFLCHFFSPGSKYSQTPFPVFLSQGRRPNFTSLQNKRQKYMMRISYLYLYTPCRKIKYSELNCSKHSSTQISRYPWIRLILKSYHMVRQLQTFRRNVYAKQSTKKKWEHCLFLTLCSALKTETGFSSETSENITCQKAVLFIFISVTISDPVCIHIVLPYRTERLSLKFQNPETSRGTD
jgi:hypothetical protein